VDAGGPRTFPAALGFVEKEKSGSKKVENHNVSKQSDRKDHDEKEGDKHERDDN
jgi:hypothetical protein